MAPLDMQQMEEEMKDVPLLPESFSARTAHPCTDCALSFTSSAYLASHFVRFHSGDRRFACGQCNKTFPYNGRLKTHMQAVHPVKREDQSPYMCADCPKEFATKLRLDRHRRTHGRARPFACPECDKTFSQNGHLRTHLRVHTGETPYCCDECGQSFRQSGHYQKHLAVHGGDHQCGVCDARFTMAGLAKHIKRHRADPEPKLKVNLDNDEWLDEVNDINVVEVEEDKENDDTRNDVTACHSPTLAPVPAPNLCTVCSMCFDSLTHLHAHHARHHVGDDVDQCARCAIRFGSQTELAHHIALAHQGAKRPPLVCPFCEKATFVNRSVLATHIRSHTNHRPHSCDQCHKTFKARRHLLSHRISVHRDTAVLLGEHAYVCDRCGKPCAEAAQLARHMGRHTHQGRLFRCRRCPATYFADNRQLTRYRLKQHNREAGQGAQPYVCSEGACGQRFAKDSARRRHERRFHSRRAYACSACGEVFDEATGRNQHERLTHGMH